jgi:DNA-binding NarL/FixJ family response regulator
VREAELERLDASLRRLGQGRSGLLAVVGEPGIGKTWLMSELRQRARAREYQVVEGRGTEFEQDAPFGLVVDALDDAMAIIAPTRLERLGIERLAELASVFPSLAGRGGRLASGLQIERFRAHFAVRAVLEELAADRPLVLALDDLHWGDQASLELVAHLLRHALSAPILVALAFRPRQAPPRLRDAIAAAARDGTLVELEVAPLTEREADELLDTDIDPERRAVLYRESGGNPFYLIELARAAARSGGRAALTDAASGATDGVMPPAVLSAISEELEDLSPPAAAFVRAAAVVGEPFDVDLVGEVAGLSPSERAAAADEVLAVDFVRRGAQPMRFRFRHPIVRRAVYEAAGEGWRIAAHARAAERLEARGAPVTARAHHVERSATWGDDRAIAVLTEAGHAAAPRAPAAAVAWFSAGLRLLPEGAPADRRLALLIPLAGALGATGRIKEAGDALSQALEAVPDDLVVIRARIAGSVARLDHMLGLHGEARALLNEALDAVGEGSLGATALRLELAIDHWFAAEWDEMAQVADQALGDASEAGDEVLVASAAGILALGRYYQGETAEAAALIVQAAGLFDALGDDRLATRIDALLCLGHAEFAMERFADGARHLGRGIAIARATGQSAWFPTLICLLGVAELWQGHLDEADRAANTAMETSRLGESRLALWAWTLRSWVTTLQGDLPGAIRAGEEAVALAARTPPFLFDWLSHGCLAAALLEAGQPERAKEEILAHAGGPDLTVVEPSWQPRWFEILAMAELANGDVAAADAWVRRAEDLAAGLGLPGRTAEARRARAAVDLARGEVDSAASAAGEAAAAFAAIERRVDAGRARTLAARALARAGRRAEATRALELAHAELEACGAVRYGDEAARELRRLGQRVPRRGARGEAREGVGALSARERQIADLVARGLTNREIAEDLFVSEKTVETHLTRAFAKVGVSSRAQLAGAIERDRAEADVREWG